MDGTPARQDHIATLDLLRLAAALAVVFFHYFFRGATAGDLVAGGYPSIAPIAIYGYLGVNLFFLISGFVIAWSTENRGWEQFAMLMPGYLRRFTVGYYLQSLVPHAMPADEGITSLLRSILTDTPSTPLSLFVLLAITVVSLALAMRIIERREYVLEQ